MNQKILDLIEAAGLQVIDIEHILAEVEKEAKTATPVLMSRTNPNGWPLESLLGAVSEDIAVKSEFIRDDESYVAKEVYHHNQQIIGLLNQAKDIQLSSLALLNQVGEDQGATGAPRIGKEK